MYTDAQLIFSCSSVLSLLVLDAPSSRSPPGWLRAPLHPLAQLITLHGCPLFTELTEGEWVRVGVNGHSLLWPSHSCLQVKPSPAFLVRVCVSTCYYEMLKAGENLSKQSPWLTLIHSLSTWAMPAILWWRQILMAAEIRARKEMARQERRWVCPSRAVREGFLEEQQ